MRKKIINSLKKDGVWKTLKKCLRFINSKFFFSNKLRKEKFINKIINFNQFERVIIFENNFCWNKIMRQRPQQIALNVDDNTLFLYHSYDDKDFDNKFRIKKVKNNLFVVDLGHNRKEILDLLSNHSNKFVMIYSTDYIPYDRVKMYTENNYKIIYEYVDDINEELCGTEICNKLLDRHKKLVDLDPYVICTATELYNKAKNDGFRKIKIITNGCDYEHFKYSLYEIPDDFKKFRMKYNSIICYYGALASWFDYKIIKKICENEKIGVLLIGQDYDGTLEKSGILKFENLLYVGKKDYDDLPAYGCNSDIFIIPFVINDITNATSPVKVFEYMAMERPIVTTALPELKKYKSVLYSNNCQEILCNIEKALNLKNNNEYINLLKREAKENTWESKANSMIDFLEEEKYFGLNDNLDDVLFSSNYDRIIIWRSPFGWNVPLFQRPQHLAKQFSEQKCLVLYEVSYLTDRVETIKKLTKNLYLVNFSDIFLKNVLHEKLKKINMPKYIQIYSTNWEMSVQELDEYKKDGYKILYEYIDDISPDLAGVNQIPKNILEKYDYAMKNNDVFVVTTANALYNDVKSKRGEKNMTYACNGVDYDFYKKIDINFCFEPEFAKIITNGKINICYYGALANWFDYDLIKKIDKANKFNIILFGIKYDDSYDKSGIGKLKNVHYLGSKNYNILKNYASKMDVLIIPFKINSITQATSPLKLFEYMALQKVIVTTAMDECKKYKSVLVADSYEDFINYLENFDEYANDTKYLKILDKEAKENDWKNKAIIILELLKKNETLYSNDTEKNGSIKNER